jgi:hypothetical protein
MLENLLHSMTTPLCSDTAIALYNILFPLAGSTLLINSSSDTLRRPDGSPLQKSSISFETPCRNNGLRLQPAIAEFKIDVARSWIPTPPPGS